MRLILTIISLAIVIGFGLILLLSPERIQAYDLRFVRRPDPDDRTVIGKIHQVAYESRASSNSLKILRLIGALWIIVALAAFVMILWQRI